MTKDERDIYELVRTWMEASRAGDTETVLSLMAEDALFMVPGQEPFDKQAFAAMSKGMADVRMDGKCEVVEVKVLDDWAWLRTHITVTMTMSGAEPAKRAGYTLTVLRKEADGKWPLARDANLLTPVE